MNLEQCVEEILQDTSGFVGQQGLQLCGNWGHGNTSAIHLSPPDASISNISMKSMHLMISSVL